MSAERGRVQAVGATHTGLQREQNEDRWLVDAARGIFCVVDGVGGHPGGEYASDIAIDMMRTRLARETGTPAERLREAITLANNAILDAARKTPSLAGMTCVLTAAVLAGKTLTVGHVGDTRLYKLRGGTLRKLTRDHSPIGEREDAGELTEAEAMRHARRNEVYRDVGAQPHEPDDDQFVEILEEPFEDDAAVLICSDGLTDQVPSATLRRVLEAHAGRPASAVDALIRAANDAGGKDNVTVVIVEGPAFARAVKASGSRSARNDTKHEAAGRDPRAEVAGPRGGWRSPWVMLPVGVLIGVLGTLAALAAWPQRPDWLRSRTTIPAPAPTVEGPRTWRVGLNPDADAASIGDAVARARPGDSILLAPGDYRESVTIRQPVALSGPAGAVIRPPLGAPPAWTAVVITGTAGARVEGLTIAGADGQGLWRGLLVEHSEVEVSGLRVSGATDAAIFLGEGARASVSTATLSDNAGSGIALSPGSRLQLRHSTVMRNGRVAGRLRPGIDMAPGADASLFGNAIGDNGGPAVAGWPAAQVPALLRDNLVRPAPRMPSRPVGGAGARPAGGPASR